MKKLIIAMLCLLSTTVAFAFGGAHFDIDVKYKKFKELSRVLSRTDNEIVFEKYFFMGEVKSNIRGRVLLLPIIKKEVKTGDDILESYTSKGRTVTFKMKDLGNRKMLITTTTMAPDINYESTVESHAVFTKGNFSDLLNGIPCDYKSINIDRDLNILTTETAKMLKIEMANEFEKEHKLKKSSSNVKIVRKGKNLGLFHFDGQDIISDLDGLQMKIKIDIEY